ncbi:MAG TPA: glucosamine-6-phosphate deaminase [Nocardioidaceae bacterium]|nr:glucosamine-6-phosphate deaminase [Nocardioidaceae bacterium]
MTATAPHRLAVRVLSDEAELGLVAAADVADELRARLTRQDSVRIVFAAAPSQRAMLERLRTAEGIDWTRVTAFHMDEYLGLPPDAPQRFAGWLKAALFEHLPLAAVHLISPDGDPQRCADDYAALLAEAPVDVVCLGIGVNGHLAFNDPPVANLSDPDAVKIVELDAECRQQQVDDGAFGSLAEVPGRAVTLTVPRLLAADRLICVVPGRHKRAAVWRALHDPVDAACPATALRTHPACTLYLDRGSDPDGC